MQRILIILLIAASSFYLGWLANDRFSPQAVSPAVVRAPVINTEPAVADNTVSVPSQEQVTATTNRTDTYSRSFRQLLAAEAFDEAMYLYDEVMAADEAQGQLLHTELMTYLRNALDQDRDEALMALVDAYLERYYDDIDVLLILAEYQRRQGYPDEAARVFQLALTYAYQPTQREKVSAALLSLVDRTDALLSRQQRWVELLGFYQLLNSIDLSSPKSLLQQAAVYLQLGDINSARSLLLALIDNPRWGSKAQQLLANIDQRAPGKPPPVAAVDAIPLLRRGNHYLVKVRLNNVSEATLMIDTGASVTSLSRNSFSSLSQHSDFDGLGPRLFNTANGIARGDVYRADAFSLGQQKLRDVNVAVLDFNQGPGVDGLLGMNVLQYFRFEIDQDKQLLLLQPRY